MPGMAIQTLPDLWLFSDERNDAMLAQALADLPEKSGFVFRHYHLSAEMRAQRFETLAKIARKCGHLIAVSGQILDDLQGCLNDPQGCLDAVYGRRPAQIAPHLLYLATAHNEAEITAANLAQADAVFVSPVFPTRSHPDSPTLGATRFHELAAQATMPVIALGGMTKARAIELGHSRWGAIDGLTPQ